VEIVLAVIFLALLLVASIAAVAVRLLRAPMLPGARSAAQAQSESRLLVVLCWAMFALSLVGAGVMANVAVQLARRPGALVAAPIGIGVACLLLAMGCVRAIQQERRRMESPSPQDSP
jgi:hypothetical protein